MLFSCSSSILLAIRTAIGSCCFAISCQHNINSAAKYSSWFVSYCFLFVATMLSRCVFLCKCKTQFIYFYFIFWFFTFFLLLFFWGGGGGQKGRKGVYGGRGEKEKKQTGKKMERERGGGERERTRRVEPKMGAVQMEEKKISGNKREETERRDRGKRRTGVAITHHCTNAQRFVNCHLLLSSHKQNGREGFSAQPKDLPPLSTNGSGVR